MTGERWGVVFRPQLPPSEHRQQIMASATEDHREAMAAFLEKRPPSYQNR